jgi:4-hydroxybenzoyl-CoA reductase subunit beta
MRLPKFEYAEPKSIKEACAILSKEPGAKVLAGGTDLLVNMKHKVEAPHLVVNLKRIPNLAFIREEEGSLRIGALSTLKKVYGAPAVLKKAAALAQAASSVGSYHHQGMGTLGGNICQQNRCMYFNQSKWWRSAKATCFKAGGENCHVVNKEGICYSSYCGDVAPALLVLDAKVVLQGEKTSREISLESLFSGNGKMPLSLQKGEILTEVIIPKEVLEGFSSYVKFASRESIDFPIVGHALWASKDGKSYRASFTAVDRKPVLGRKVQAFLEANKLGEDVMEEAAAMASKEATPVKNSVHSPSHKRRMMGVLLKRNLNEVLRRMQ